MTLWKMAKLQVEREYEIENAPDLRDETSKRRLVIRPDRLRLHQIYGTNLVRKAWIEGRLVRAADGELGGRRMICAGHISKWYSDANEPPSWLNSIVEDEGLEWATDANGGAR